jgi:hypothetical protein
MYITIYINLLKSRFNFELLQSKTHIKYLNDDKFHFIENKQAIYNFRDYILRTKYS